MQKLYTSRDHGSMEKLYGFLQQRGIPVTVSEHGEQLELWLIQTSYAALAKELVAEFKANPTIAESPQHEPALSPYAADRSPRIPRGTPSLVGNLLSQAGVVTISFAVLVIAVFLGQLSPLSDGLFELLRISDNFASIPWQQPWRVITPALLHFSVLHILFNVFWWWYLGGRFERLYGSIWLVVALVVCATISNIAQFMVSGPYFGGLSGVVYGLFGIAVVMAWQRPSHPLYLPPGLIGFLLFWLVLGYTDLLWVNVANTAHTAGLISGLLVGGIMRGLSR